MYSEGCEYVNIAWALGSKVLPLFKQFKVFMALDNLLLPTRLSVQQRKNKKNQRHTDGGNGSKVRSKKHDKTSV